MTATLAITPESPRPVTDGVLFAVRGPVLPRGHIVLKDSSGHVRGVSPEFGQRDKSSGNPEQDVFAYAITGSPGGGTFKLGLYSQLEDKTYETGTIAYNAADADVQAALRAVTGLEATVVSSGVVSFPDRPVKGLSLTLADNSLSGGSSPTVAIVKETAEAAGLPSVAGGPYYWGPIYLPAVGNAPSGNYTADVICTVSDADVPIYEGDSFLSGPVTVYDYPA